MMIGDALQQLRQHWPRFAFDGFNKRAWGWVIRALLVDAGGREQASLKATYRRDVDASVAYGIEIALRSGTLIQAYDETLELVIKRMDIHVAHEAGQLLALNAKPVKGDS